MQHYNPTNTPIIQGESLNIKIFHKTPKENQEMETISYSSIVGNLMYTMMCT